MFITGPIRWLLLYKQLTTTQKKSIHFHRKSVQTLASKKKNYLQNLTEFFSFPCTRILHFVSKSKRNPCVIIPPKIIVNFRSHEKKSHPFSLF